MILYLSNATNYSIYNTLFRQEKIKGGYQMQKFNSNLITGLGHKEKVVALSALPYLNIKADRIDTEIDGIHYISIKNNKGFSHKFSNLCNLYIEGAKICKENKPDFILCDAIAKSPCYISQILGKRFHVPVIGIITDLPGMLTKNRRVHKGLKRMQNFDAFILLTNQMNYVINPQKKPYIIMEGLCAEEIPDFYPERREKTLVYAGALWKKDAGIEYFVEGFLKANFTEYELHFYGTGALVPWIEEISKKYKQVKYMGCVTNEEIVDIQRKATLLVNPRPSKEEFCQYSFPSKTIEYMASGTPVLMTKLPGVPKEYFDYVYTIEDETADGVCDILKKILRQESRRLNEFGLRARRFVLNNKGCNMQAERVVNFFKDKILRDTN